ncbi:hypothetical protein GCM10009430_27750 [Aquimarina litoralis]|uniref:Replication protein n=1 Tax=Aquimarina litoralis TaxID=584605 RepID=A0ABP3U430_9FLAO
MNNIYTLAESGTNKSGQKHLIVNGNGSDLNNNKALKGRAKRKIITQSLMLRLIDIAKEDGEPELEKAFWNTYYCQQNIITADGKLYGNYCKNRFCTICCSIRKADIINRYLPTIQKWEDPHFVTITVKSCKEHQLEAYIKSLKGTFKKIINKYKKQDQRGKGKKLIGIKSLESNFNPERRTYNPHFHIIVANREMADIIVAEWYSRSKKGYVSLKAQKTEKIWNLENALVEIIKYGSKIFTEPDLKKRAKETTTTQVYAKALYNIFKAIKGARIFDRFGFDLPERNIEKPQVKLLSHFEEWEYNIDTTDWVNVYTTEVLTGYKIPSPLIALLTNNINDSID